MAEIKLLQVSDDGRPPYWHFTSSFDFDLQCMCNYTHVILHPPAKFRSNRTNISGLLMSYRCFKMVVIIESELRNLLPRSGLVTALVQNGENLFAYQISIRYLNPRLR